MATPTAAHQPYLDVDHLAPLDIDEASWRDAIMDPLGPSRGILLSVVMCAPFWLLLYWFLG